MSSYSDFVISFNGNNKIEKEVILEIIDICKKKGLNYRCTRPRD